MNYNCHISDLVHAFSYVENGGLKLILKLAKLLTSMTVASNSIILTTMRVQNKQQCNEAYKKSICIFEAHI